MSDWDIFYRAFLGFIAWVFVLAILYILIGCMPTGKENCGFEPSDYYDCKAPCPEVSGVCGP